MADPITVIGATSSIVAIVEVLCKTISMLHDLHSRWQEANFIFINLISQLTALKAALSKIQEWIDSDLTDLHHQLIMDLGVSITCCRMLVGKMDNQISGLHESTASSLDMRSKLKLALKGGSMEAVQKMIEQQTNALTLLLTACNCKTISEQKDLLEKRSTRKTFKQMQDCSSSLVANRDSISFHSRYTDSLSKLSMIFEFDGELFLSKVYERALRGSLKQAIKARQQANLFKEMETKQSREIDKTIQRDAELKRSQVKILLIGESAKVKDDFVKQLKVSCGGFSGEEKDVYRKLVRDTLRGIVAKLLEVFNSNYCRINELVESKMNETTKRLLTTIDLGLGSNWKVGLELVEAAEALRFIWSQMMVEYEEGFPDSTQYFVDQLERISGEYYIPTEDDILKAPAPNSGMQEHHLNIGGINVRLLYNNDHMSKSSKLIDQFEGIDCLYYLVDIINFDQVTPTGESIMTESLNTFKHTIDTRWPLNRSAIIIFINVNAFKLKFHSSPLNKGFTKSQCYSDLTTAEKYIASLFKDGYKERQIYSVFLDERDIRQAVSLVSLCTRDVFIQSNLMSLVI